MLTTEGKELYCYITGNPKSPFRHVMHRQFFEDIRLDVKYAMMAYVTENCSKETKWTDIWTEEDCIDVAYKIYKETRKR